ncbi:MAG: hypothetical protein V4641_09800 [Pseudomonadota bacterium]
MKDDLQPGIIAEAKILAPSVESAQREAETRNAAKRQAERQAKMDAWQDPEAMAYRKAVHEKGAIESLWELRANGQCAIDRDVPVPPDSELPKHMRGQAPSTVRAFLRGSADWKAKVEAHAKANESKAKIQEQYPELFGIDFGALRREGGDIAFEQVRTGHRIAISGDEFVKALAQKPKKGAVARFFAGIKEAFEEL